MTDDDRDNPIEQLVELFVYAPVGLLYEYEDVLPKLIKRGRSQVQLARVLGQVAVQRSQGGAEDVLGDVVAAGAGLFARVVTEMGAAVGLAPTSTTGWPPADAGSTGPTGDDPPPAGGGSGGDATIGAQRPADGVAPGPEAAERSVETANAGLPIAGYDDLPARVIVPLLDDLTPAQRETIRAYETGRRARKTILGKLDRIQQV